MCIVRFEAKIDTTLKPFDEFNEQIHALRKELGEGIASVKAAIWISGTINIVTFIACNVADALHWI